MRHAYQTTSRRLTVALTAMLILAAVAFSTAVLQAQDSGSDAPDGAARSLYLPAIRNGAANVPQAGDTIPGQYVVVLQDPAIRAANGNAETAAQFADRIVTTYGGRVLYTYSTALSGFAAALPDTAVTSLASDPNVASIEPDQIVAMVGTQTGATWGLDRIDQANLPLNGTYIYNTDAANVNAYVIDTGILGTHTQFSGRVGNGYDAVGDGNGTTDCNGHGTHVSGTIGGTTYGVAKRVTLHPVRVLNCSGSGSNSGVIAGVDWVTTNAVHPAVANMSLGGGASSALDLAIHNSIVAGVVYAVAAGNSNANACNYSPARVADALTAGASTSSDGRASFSNYGTCLDIFAPGDYIVSSYIGSDSATATLSGTSMASPHVAGAIALYLSLNPNATAAQVATALIGNAISGKVTSVGTGSPNLLLYTGFIGSGSPTPTFTPAPPTTTATATPTRTTVPPTATATATPTPTTVRPTATATATPTPTTVRPTATATATATATTTATPRPTATATPAPVTCRNLLGNASFEQGIAPWALISSKGYSKVCTNLDCNTTIPPHSGSYLSRLGGGNSETGELRQTITLPAAQPAYLSYWYRINSSDYCGWDYGYVRVISGATTTTLKTHKLCTTYNSATWQNLSLDLSAYAGRSITVVFRGTTDYSLISHFYLDDIALTTSATCSGSSISPAEMTNGVDIVPDGVKPATPQQ